MQRLAQLRKQHGLNQQKLSEILGLSRSTIAMWETGASKPDMEILAKLANIFNTTSDYLIGITDDPRKPTDPLASLPQPFFRLAKEAQKLGLSDKDVDAILNLYHSHLDKNK